MHVGSERYYVDDMTLYNLFYPISGSLSMRQRITFLPLLYRMDMNCYKMYVLISHDLGIITIRVTYLYTLYIVSLVDDKLGGIQIGFFRFGEAAFQSPSGTLLPPKPRPKRENN